MKRILSYIISLILMSALFMPISQVQAKQTVDDGWAGKQATCNVSDDGTLTVTGKGSVNLEFKISGGGKHIKKVAIEEGITRIATYGISLDSVLEIRLPQSLVSLDYGAFAWNRSLSSIRLPNGIKSLPTETFSNCEKLKRISLPKNLRSIGKKAFNKCKSLKSLTIPDKVTSIGKDAFKNCRSLETLVLPKNLKKYGADFKTTPMLHKVVNRSKKWIPLDSSGGKRVWKVGGKKVTKLAPGKTATTKGARYKLSYALSGGKAKGKLPKYYYYGETPKLPAVYKKGYTFLGWRSLKHNLNIPKEFPADRGDNVELTAMLIQLKVERQSATSVKFTIKDSIKWDAGSVSIFKTPASLFHPQYAVRIFTVQPTEDNEEDDQMNEDSQYKKMKPGGSCVFTDLDPDKKYYFEVTFRWVYLEGDDYDSMGHYSGWHLHQKLPE